LGDRQRHRVPCWRSLELHDGRGHFGIEPKGVSMSMIVHSAHELTTSTGRELGATDWLTVEQTRIDAFAEATGDRQWIHVDVERARRGPFGATIAHGYLVLSLVSLFLPQLLEVRGATMGINYGCDRVRFPSAVRAGSRIR